MFSLGLEAPVLAPLLQLNEHGVEDADQRFEAAEQLRLVLVLLVVRPYVEAGQLGHYKLAREKLRIHFFRDQELELDCKVV